MHLRIESEPFLLANGLMTSPSIGTNGSRGFFLPTGKGFVLLAYEVGTIQGMVFCTTASGM